MEIDPDNNNEIVKSYVYAQDDLIAQYNGPQDSAAIYFYICDRLGNVRQVIDVNASVQYLYSYGPFGKVLEADEDADPPGNAFQFTGQFYDADLNQYYLRARQYSPDLARFTARDPYPGQFQEPLTLHAYLYCLDDPINRTDLTGEFSYLQTTVTAAKYGLMAWSAYSTYQTVKGYAQQIASGVAIRSVLIDVCIDVSLSWGAGKALGFITKVGAPLISRVGQKIAKKGGKKIAKKAKDPSHHFATNKNQTYTPQMEEITEKYGLDLDSDWNIEDISKLYHRGRHPNKYHDFVLRNMKKADAEAAGDADKFLELFDKYIVDPVMENPELLQKDGW
jgi:RHS repeat-associated protein